MSLRRSEVNYDELPRVIFGHERPLQAGGKTCTTASTQPRLLHLVNDPLWALIDEIFGAIPVALEKK